MNLNITTTNVLSIRNCSSYIEPMTSYARGGLAQTEVMDIIFSLHCCVAVHWDQRRSVRGLPAPGPRSPKVVRCLMPPYHHYFCRYHRSGRSAPNATPLIVIVNQGLLPLQRVRAHDDSTVRVDLRPVHSTRRRCQQAGVHSNGRRRHSQSTRHRVQRTPQTKRRLIVLHLHPTVHRTPPPPLPECELSGVAGEFNPS